MQQTRQYKDLLVINKPENNKTCPHCIVGRLTYQGLFEVTERMNFPNGGVVVHYLHKCHNCERDVFSETKWNRR